MGKYDIVFFHPYRMLQDGFEYPLFPMGFISMASLLKREGYNVTIVNLPLEKVLSGAQFDIESLLRSFEFEVAAIDLHWWVHSYDSIQLAKLCKKIYPNCLTVLGGLTASFFASEIMRKFPFIDVILKGDGEIPIQSLAKNYFRKKSLRDTPNSVLRENGKIYENNISYVADSLDDFVFTDVTLLHHWEEHFWLHGGPNNFNLLRGDTVFSPWLCIARGCPFECSFCGGTKEAQYLCSGRQNVIRRSSEKVVEDIKFLESIGVRTVYFSHEPAKVGEKYFSEILNLLRKEHADVWGFIELWQLPSINFIEELEKSFSNLTFRIILGSGSEEVRRLNRGITTSNTEFLKALDICLEAGIGCHICFSSNSPMESKESLKETWELIEKLILEKNITNIFPGNYSIEPASPIYLQREKFNVISKIREFTDYYDLLKKWQTIDTMGLVAPSGYHTKTLSEKDSQNFIKDTHAKIDDYTGRLKTRSVQYSFY